MKSMNELSEWNWESEDNEGLLDIVREQIDINVIKHLDVSLDRIKAIRRATDSNRDEHERGLEELVIALHGAIEHWVYQWEVTMEAEETNRYTATVEARTYDDAKTLAYSKFQDGDVEDEHNVYSEGHSFGDLVWNVDQQDED